MYTMSLRVFAETLAEAIRLDISPELLTNLNRAITSYPTFDNGKEFLIASTQAFYLGTHLNPSAGGRRGD